MATIYAYNNHTESSLPNKIGNITVNYLLGKTVSDVHSNIKPNSTLFIVFTHLDSADIAVSNEEDAEVLRSLLSVSKFPEATVSVNEKSLWYSTNAKKNVIISDTLTMSALELSGLFLSFLSDTLLAERSSKNMYKVKNTRNSKVILTTPLYEQAVSKCDAIPCTVIIDNTNTIVYKSKYGKVSIPPKRETISDSLKDILRPNKMNGIKVRF